jgi:hypothetical protein
MRNLSIGLTTVRHALAFTVFLSGCLGGACFGQTVTVRIVNAEDGKPVAAHKILISGINGKSYTPDQARQNLTVKHGSADATLVTDAQGRVQFDLPADPPPSFYVRAVLRPPVWDCSCVVTVHTEELLRKGLWFGSRDDASSELRPGEIIFRIRPNPLWVRVFWPFLVDRPF